MQWRPSSDAPGEETRVVEVWKRTSTGAQQDTATNLNNYYNAFSKPLTLQTSKGPRQEIFFFVGEYFSSPSLLSLSPILLCGNRRAGDIGRNIEWNVGVLGRVRWDGCLFSRNAAFMKR